MVFFFCSLNWEFFSLKLGKNILFAIGNTIQYQSSEWAKKPEVSDPSSDHTVLLYIVNLYHLTHDNITLCYPLFPRMTPT